MGCTKFQIYLTTNDFTIALRRFTGHFWARKGSQAPKNQNFQKIKHVALGTSPYYKCTKFQKYLTTNDFTIALRRFTGHFWARKGSQEPKNQNFQKIKNVAVGTGSCYECTKFQKYLTTKYLTWHSAGLRAIFGSEKGPKRPRIK